MKVVKVSRGISTTWSPFGRLGISPVVLPYCGTTLSLEPRYLCRARYIEVHSHQEQTHCSMKSCVQLVYVTLEEECTTKRVESAR